MKNLAHALSKSYFDKNGVLKRYPKSRKIEIDVNEYKKLKAFKSLMENKEYESNTEQLINQLNK